MSALKFLSMSNMGWRPKKREKNWDFFFLFISCKIHQKVQNGCNPMYQEVYKGSSKNKKGVYIINALD